MDSRKTKSDKYVLVRDKAVAGVVLVPEGDLFFMYVAWEWENMAKKKFFAITKDSALLDQYTSQSIINTAGFGADVTNDLEARKLFPLLF